MDRTADRARAASGFVERSHDLRLRLEHLVAQVVAHLLAREPNEAEAVEVVQVRGDAIEMTDARLRADHVETGRDELRGHNSDAEWAATADVDRRVGAPLREEPKDARLVWRHHVEDACVRGVAVLLVVDVSRSPQELLAACS